jgi:hypothetical protein
VLHFFSFRTGFILVASLYFLSFPYHPALRSPNELCRLWQARALVDEGTIDIAATLQKLGMVGDLSCTAVLADGQLKPCVGPEAPARDLVTAVRYYPSKAPLLSFLGAPVYAVLKVFGEVSELSQVLWSRLFITILPTLWCLFLLRRLLKNYVSPAVSDWVTMVYALGTMAFSYAESFMSHQLTAVLLFVAFWHAFLIEERKKSEWLWLSVGLFGGAAVACEYTGALGVLAMSTYVVVARFKTWPALLRAAGLVCLGSLPMLAFVLVYHQRAFGSPWLSGYKFLNDAAYMNWHQGGFLGIKGPDARALGLSLFSPLRGLFALSPFLVFGGWGLVHLKSRSRSLFVMTLVMVLANLYFTSAFNYDSWGWTTGPRHLTPMIPFLMLPFALFLEASSSLKSALGHGFGVSSSLATMLVTHINYVPPELSTSLFGLAVPLYLENVMPVSWLQAFVPNPLSGASLLALSVTLSLWLFEKARAVGASWRVMLLAIAVHLGALKLATRGDAADAGARNFLKSVWVSPPGQSLHFRH